MNVEQQELYCHDCDRYVQFPVDLDMDGNHVFKCPNCGHEHCRVVKDGKITDVRWDSRNGPTIPVQRQYITYSYQSYTDTSTGSSTFLKSAWADSTATYTYGTDSYTFSYIFDNTGGTVGQMG